MATLTASDALTKRERETLVHTVLGRSSKETARLMGCGARTVEDYRRNVMKKYKARNAVELVRAFYRLDDLDAVTSPSQRTLAEGS